MKSIIPNITLPSIDPDHIIGCKFTVEHSGTTQKAKITEQVENKTYPTEYAEGNDDHLTL